jgi:hypothetical protein
LTRLSSLNCLNGYPLSPLTGLQQYKADDEIHLDTFVQRLKDEKTIVQLRFMQECHNAFLYLSNYEFLNLFCTAA